MSDSTRRLNVDLPLEQMQALALAKVQDGKSISDRIRELVAAWMAGR